MNLLEHIIKLISGEIEDGENRCVSGYCPNCWGEQEYDTIIRRIYKDKQVDVNNHQQHHAFIQEFVINKIDGIQLRKGEVGWECPHCKRRFETETPC